MEKLNETYLNGIRTVNNHRLEINTGLPLVSVYGHRIDFTARGEQANEIISQLWGDFSKGNVTLDDVLSKFVSSL